MQFKIFFTVTILLLASALWVIPVPADSTADIPRITKDALKDRLGEANLVIIDVRIARDWEKSKEKIAGSVHHDPKDIDVWSGAYSAGQTLVLYCA